MTRITEKPCDLCGAESFEWYQTVCHGCGDAFCRGCAGPWPHYCIRCEGPDEAHPSPDPSAAIPPPDLASQDAITALAEIRTALAEQHEATTSHSLAHQSLSPPDPRMPPAWQAFHEIMTRLDGIIRMIRAVPEGAPPPTSAGAVAQPASTQVMDPSCSDEVPASLPAVHAAGPHPSRPAFGRFAWIAVLVTAIIAGTLGVIAQQQHTLLESPDATNGWKDRVWELTGEEIARCIVTAAPGTCVVTVVEGGGDATTPP